MMVSDRCFQYLGGYHQQYISNSHKMKSHNPTMAAHFLYDAKPKNSNTNYCLDLIQLSALSACEFTSLSHTTFL